MNANGLGLPHAIDLTGHAQALARALAAGGVQSFGSDQRVQRFQRAWNGSVGHAVLVVDGLFGPCTCAALNRVMVDVYPNVTPFTPIYPARDGTWECGGCQPPMVWDPISGTCVPVGGGAGQGGVDGGGGWRGGKTSGGAGGSHGLAAPFGTPAALPYSESPLERALGLGKKEGGGPTPPPSPPPKDPNGNGPKKPYTGLQGTPMAYDQLAGFGIGGAGLGRAGSPPITFAGLGSCCQSCQETGGSCGGKRDDDGDVPPQPHSHGGRPTHAGGHREPTPAPHGSPWQRGGGHMQRGGGQPQRGGGGPQKGGGGVPTKAPGLSAPFGTPAALPYSEYGLGAAPNAPAANALLAGLTDNSVANSYTSESGPPNALVTAFQAEWSTYGSPPLPQDGLYGGCTAAALGVALGITAPQAEILNQSDGGLECTSGATYTLTGGGGGGPPYPDPGNCPSGTAWNSTTGQCVSTGGGPPGPVPTPGATASSNTGLIVVGGIVVAAAVATALVASKKKRPG